MASGIFNEMSDDSGTDKSGGAGNQNFHVDRPSLTRCMLRGNRFYIPLKGFLPALGPETKYSKQLILNQI